METGELFSIRKTFNVAFAYVGILTGAGLASGREVMQYFVSFGFPGYIGVIVTALLFMIFGKWIISLGSFYRAENHMDVLSEISHPLISKILDWTLTFACFVMSFVMIAGAGSNLSQQFDLAPWVGSLICALLILGVSHLDFDKVTTALGIFTPMMIGILAIALIALVMGPTIDWHEMFIFAGDIPTSLPNAALSVLNYFGLCLMISTSMLFVLGGNVLGLGNANKGGYLGGFFAGIISLVTATLLFSQVDKIWSQDVPMLTLMNAIHPYLGLVMFVIIFGMIFNTGFSVTYALAKRLSRNNAQRFKWLMPVVVFASFVLSFVGFSELVAVMYPILGYIGILLVVTITVAWIRDKQAIDKEKGIRRKLFRLTMRKKAEDQSFTQADEKQMTHLYDISETDEQTLREDMGELADKTYENQTDKD